MFRVVNIKKLNRIWPKSWYWFAAIYMNTSNQLTNRTNDDEGLTAGSPTMSKSTASNVTGRRTDILPEIRTGRHHIKCSSKKRGWKAGIILLPLSCLDDWLRNATVCGLYGNITHFWMQFSRIRPTDRRSLKTPKRNGSVGRWKQRNGPNLRKVTQLGCRNRREILLMLFEHAVGSLNLCDNSEVSKKRQVSCTTGCSRAACSIAKRHSCVRCVVERRSKSGVLITSERNELRGIKDECYIINSHGRSHAECQ